MLSLYHQLIGQFLQFLCFLPDFKPEAESVGGSLETCPSLPEDLTGTDQRMTAQQLSQPKLKQHITSLLSELDGPLNSAL